MSINEGAEVTYRGLAKEGLSSGDVGTVLLSHDLHAHVSWKTGSKRGEVVMVHTDDLKRVGDYDATNIKAALADSLWVDSTTEHHSAPTLYAEGGASGVISDLSARGNVDFLTEVASEAMDSVATRVAQMVDVEVRGLDDEAKDDVVQRLTARLFREMLAGEEDD